MYILSLEMFQYDCPIIDSSEKTEAGFFITNFDFRPSFLRLRSHVNAKDPEDLQNAIEVLKNHNKVVSLEVVERENNRALLKMESHTTNAMEIVRKHNGYLVGPFHAIKSREIWKLGFDKKTEIEETLSELDNNYNSFKVRRNVRIDSKDFWRVLECIPNIVELINTIEKMTLTEKIILRSAIKLGYFGDPKNVDLSDLAKIFKITKSGASRNIRRAERKILAPIEKIITSKLKDTDFYDSFL